jgi:serine/threonine protein phosphatase PrpC
MWNLISASATGTSHTKNNLPCQDAHRWALMQTGTLLIAVADGAGSAERSQAGATCAVEVAIAFLEGALTTLVPEDEPGWERLLTEAFKQARAAVFALADADNLSPRMFACTLTLVIANDEWLVTGQIGDGVVVAQTLSGELITVAPPQRGEYANETHFLIADDALTNFDGRIYRQHETIEALTALAVMTDGLLRLALDLTVDRPHAPFFTPLLHFPAAPHDPKEARDQLYAFLDSPRVNARTDDDKTLVLAARIQ